MNTLEIVSMMLFIADRKKNNEKYLEGTCRIADATRTYNLFDRLQDLIREKVNNSGELDNLPLDERNNKRRELADKEWGDITQVLEARLKQEIAKDEQEIKELEKQLLEKLIEKGAGDYPITKEKIESIGLIPQRFDTYEKDGKQYIDNREEGLTQTSK